MPVSNAAVEPVGNRNAGTNAELSTVPLATMVGATAPGICIRGCGRERALGVDRWGQPFDTCCRACALGRGHDATCGALPREVTGDMEYAMALQLAELEDQRIANAEMMQQDPYPRTMVDPLWGDYQLDRGRVPLCLQAQCFGFCPCLMIGCGKDARRAWKTFLLSWSVFLTLVQVTTLVLAIALYGGMVSYERNPMLGPHYHAFDIMGAKNAARILEYGEWYRLATSMLLHGGWMHLIGNVLVQLRVGIMLEVLWGGTLWIIIYVVSGVYASLLSCVMAPDHLGIGSSGALCGLIGAWFAFILITWNQTLPRDVNERNVMLFNVGMAILVVAGMSFLPLMDYAAHFGGLAMGGALAMVLFAGRLQQRSWCLATRAGGCLVLLVMVPFTLWWFLAKTHPNPLNLDLCAPPCGD